MSVRTTILDKVLVATGAIMLVSALVCLPTHSYGQTTGAGSCANASLCNNGCHSGTPPNCAGGGCSGDTNCDACVCKAISKSQCQCNK